MLTSRDTKMLFDMLFKKSGDIVTVSFFFFSKSLSESASQTLRMINPLIIESLIYTKGFEKVLYQLKIEFWMRKILATLDIPQVIGFHLQFYCVLTLIKQISVVRGGNDRKILSLQRVKKKRAIVKTPCWFRIAHPFAN